ncbi:MAG: queuine tRNA-ribosyltransferase [Legionellaceae bacterium]|nr:queuine tRNA-ribosyltransferase [Legionellaceae bacterium]
MKQSIVPSLSTLAGSCLTGLNWQEVGVEVVAYSLSALLMKPGIDLLNNIPNLASYVGWQKTLVLNATAFTLNAQGLYCLRSIYDGSRYQYSAHELLTLIVKLSPQYVILPKGMGQHSTFISTLFPETITPFFPIEEYPSIQAQSSYGLYFNYSNETAETFLECISEHQDRLRYVVGYVPLETLQHLSTSGVDLIESNRPAQDALDGFIYHPEQSFFIMDEAQRMTFDVIDVGCACPVCNQKLTRAYLHHLYQQTPLLCQRLLIQHNVFYTCHLPQA